MRCIFMKLMSNLSFKNVIKQYEKKYNTKYCETTQELLKKYYDEGIDISSCMDPRIDYLDLEIFLNDLRNGLDVKLYNKVSLSRAQMCEIRDGLQRGLDAKVYAKVKYKRKSHESNQNMFRTQLRSSTDFRSSFVYVDS